MRTNCGLYIYTALIVVLGSLSSCQWLPEVGKVSLSESSVTLKVGGSRQLSATVEPAAAEYDGITWSTSDRSVVSVSNGTIVAEKVGSATVTASAEGVTSAPCTVTVQAINVTGVYLNYSAIEITEGQSTSLKATVTPSDATDQSVQWSSGNTSVATVSGGSIKAVAPGKTAITVTTNDGGKTASCQVTVKAKVIPVTGVWIDQSTLSLTEGESGQLKATVSPSNATNKDVTWTSSNTSVATVSSGGTVTAKKAGTATITVKTADQGKTATCNVTVTAKSYPVTGVSLSQSSLALTVGETSRLIATVSPSNATNKDVSWSSSKTSVATVSSDGTVTAKAVGSATITVTTADGSKKATCSVTVQSVSVTGVSLNPATMSLVVGSTGTLTATVSPSNATNKAVTYSSSNPAVAKASSDGVVTALAAGSTTITVKTADGGKTATCIVTVKKATVAVTGVTVTRSSMTLGVGESYKLGYSIKPSNATDQSVTWFSRYAPVAKVASDGTVTGISPGTAEIVVLTNDGNYTASCMITVKAVSVAVTGVSLDKSSMSLVAGSTGTLKATIAPSTATNKGVTWSSSNTAVATVSTSGVVTAKAAGSATITCTTADGGKTAKCEVTVTQKPAVVAGVKLNVSVLNLEVGAQAILQATVQPDNASNKNVTWTSSEESVAVVDQRGVVTGVGIGTATVTATTEDGGKTATCEVNVKEATVTPTSVKIEPATLSVKVGASEQLTATVGPEGAPQDVSWSSSATSIATVDKTGKVTGVKAGTATITVKTQTGNKTATCKVTVTNATVAVTGIKLNKSTTSLKVGGTETLVATITPSDATNKKVTWSTSAGSVATIDQNGKVTAVKAGTATITAKTADGGKTASCKVTVTNATVAVTGVSLDKTSLSLEEGKIATLTATVSPSNATNKSVTWSSSNTSITTVSSSGVVTAKAAGTATITVTTSDGGKTATCAVTVQSIDNHNYPKNSIHGAFSVSSTTQVCFARANIDKDGSLLEHQYSVWTSGYNGGDVTNGLINLAESDASTIINQSSALGSSWRLLSKDEWTYLINNRKNADKRFYVCPGAYVWGLLIAPDDWVMPENFALQSIDTGNNYNISFEDLADYEALGFIFLPIHQAVEARPYGTGYQYYFTATGGGRYALDEPINVSTGSWNKNIYSGYRFAIPQGSIVYDRYDYNQSSNSYGTMFTAVRAAYDL